MADPGGEGHPDPEIEGSGFKTFFFSALRTSVWSKTKGGGGEGSGIRQDRLG